MLHLELNPKPLQAAGGLPMLSLPAAPGAVGTRGVMYA